MSINQSLIRIELRRTVGRQNTPDHAITASKVISSLYSVYVADLCNIDSDLYHV